MTALHVWLVEILARRLGIASSAIDPRRPFAEYGLSSRDALILIGEIEEHLDRSLPDTLFWDHPSIETLANALEGEQAAVTPVQVAAVGPIAVIGLACRFPGAPSAAAFWSLLANGRDAIGEAPKDRWAADLWTRADDIAMASPRAGCIDAVDRFDAAYFGLALREAAHMDPQQRLLLELSIEALDDAGLPAERIAGSRAGVFVGISTNDYARLGNGDPHELTAWTGTGNALSVAANRVSYTLDLRGPSMAIDTACSSSLVAVHQACASLRSGESTIAIAGGVNLLLSPDWSVVFSQARMLSPDGVCRTFDVAANGYVRGEGGGIVVLKPLSRALADGDRVRAVIRGSAVNQDGRSNGLTAPNGPSQSAVIREALSASALGPADIDAIEAHGTATPLGDPIEVAALQRVFGEYRARGSTWLGSVKTNIGHLEAAAGIAGLIKAILSLEERAVPAHLHLRALNQRIMNDGTFRIPATLEPWNDESCPRRYGVSSFGFGGTNAHAIVESAPAPQIEPQPPTPGPALIVVSAATRSALSQRCRDLAEVVRRGIDLQNLSWTLACRRTHLRHRAAVVADDADTLASLLERGDIAVDLDRSDEAAFLADLGRRWCAGEHIDWSKVHPQPRTLVDLPAYPWQRERCWLPLRPSADRAWRAAVSAARRREEWGPHDLVPEAVTAGFAALDRFAIEVMSDALRRLGCFVSIGERMNAEETAVRAGVKPTYALLLERWLRHLADAGRLTREDDAFVALAPLAGDLAGSLAAARRALPDAAFLIDYVARSGESAPDVLRGAASPLENLFPASSLDTVEALYHTWTLPRYFNGLTCETLQAWRAALPPRDALRVIEVGAGTGGMTRALLQTLPFDRMEYVFTDVSEFFFSRMRGVLAAFPFVRFGKLDLDADPAEQGYPHGRFDVVVAANVLHATRHLGRTLDRVAGLLRPGGLLLAYEVTTPFAWLDVSVALIEGWQRFDDELRTDGPLLSAELWRTAIAARGFDEVATFPNNGPASSFGQHVIAARRSVDAVPQAAKFPVAPTPEATAQVPAWTYEVQWEDVPPPSADEKATITVLLAASGGDPVLAALTEQLPAASVIVAPPGTPFDISLLPSLTGNRLPLVMQIVDLRPLGRSPAAGFSPASLVASVSDAAVQALDLAGTPPPEGSSLCITFVTRGARALQEDSAPPDPVQAAVAAIAGVAAHEVSAVRVKQLDIDPKGAPELQARWIRAVATGTTEERDLAVRANRLRASRLRACTVPDAPVLIHADATYVITGGLGVLGARVARRLANRGARHLVLIGRTAAPDAGLVLELGAEGVAVQVLAADVADSGCWDAVTALVANGTCPPIRGVVHAAGDVSGFRIGSRPNAIVPALSAKLAGPVAADDALKEQPLDFCVFFSSAAATLGPPGSALYAAANACGEAVMAGRRARGLAGTAIAWGVWDDTGPAARDITRQFAKSGWPQIDEAAGLVLFERLATATGTCLVLPGTPSEWASHMRTLAGDPLLSASAPPAPAAPRPVDLEAHIVGELATVLELPASSIDLTMPPTAAGLDSLMALDLQARLQQTLGVSIPVSTLLSAQTLQEVIDEVRTATSSDPPADVADWETSRV